MNEVVTTRPAARRWATFLRNDAQSIIACDFFVAVTATFRLLYLWSCSFITDRAGWCTTTSHGTSDTAWTLQQLREAIAFEREHDRSIHDRDSIIFTTSVDRSIRPTSHRNCRASGPNAVLVQSVLGGLHHEYSLAPAGA